MDAPLGYPRLFNAAVVRGGRPGTRMECSPEEGWGMDKRPSVRPYQPCVVRKTVRIHPRGLALGRGLDYLASPEQPDHETPLHR